MKYKVSDELMKSREYGRNIQMMVNYAKKLKDDDERNALVHEITRIMACINPSVKENPDFQNRVWDTMYFIADFDIKVDTKFMMPKPEVMLGRPQRRMPYYAFITKMRQYGQNVEHLITKAGEMTDKDEQHALVTLIANYMKLQFKVGEKDSLIEASVCEHMRMLSKGKLQFQPSDIRFVKAPPPMLAQTNPPPKKISKKKKKKRNR